MFARPARSADLRRLPPAPSRSQLQAVIDFNARRNRGSSPGCRDQALADPPRPPGFRSNVGAVFPQDVTADGLRLSACSLIASVYTSTTRATIVLT